MPLKMSNNTVDEVWKRIQNSPKKSGEVGGGQRLERQPAIGAMPLEEFLVRAGVVREDLPANMDAVGSSVIAAAAPSCNPLHLQGSIRMPLELSNNTVDEVWKGNQDSPKRSSEEGGGQRLERQLTIGDMTLEEFLVRAGFVREDLPANMDAVGSSQKLAKKDGASIDRQNGIEVLWNFYMEYKQQKQERMRESGTFITEMGTRDVEMKKIYANLRALLDALEILVGESPTHRLGRQILEEVEALEDMVSPAPSSLIKVAVQDVSQQETKQIESTVHHMPLQQLKKVTNNFCHELGRGGFGVVYKGMLENGQLVAVKKLVQSVPSSQEQFENEVNLLAQLKHPNIARLVGYCYETQHLRMPLEEKFVFAQHIDCLLCLEFLTNGSLDKYISDASSGLDWPTRCEIIKGISCGLQYLHEQSNDPIIHLDLKPANILLDENMVPKITDFGLSRLFHQNQTIHTVHTSGTLGYMPPEYLRGIITPMSDIFSLGVIIMEVITGHREYPYDIRATSKDFIELELQKWRNRLQKEPVYTSLETDCQQIERCLQIGLICVNTVRTRRPTMKKIIDMLQGLESMNWYISNELSSHDIQVDP